MPVKRLLIQMSWPVMLSMLIQALYNLVDSIFVAQINEKAFLSVSYAFPVQSFMIAICVGTGVGVNAILSRRLGERRYEDANAVALNGYLIYLVCFALFFLFGLLGTGTFLTYFTSDAQIVDYGSQYLGIVCCCSVGMCLQFAGERVLQATGHATGYMMIQGVGVVFNLIFDPVLIFGIGPFPVMGIRGAAIATVGGQILGALLGIFLVARVKELRLHLRKFRPCPRTIRDIYRIGFPAIITQILVTVMLAGMNKILGVYSDTLVFILGAYFKLQAFAYMPVFGLNTGMVPIIGYNYGAGHPKRITDTVRFAMAIAIAVMLGGTILFQVFPGPLLAMFNPTEEILASGVPALRIIAVSFPIAAVTVIFSSAFQALGAPMLSLFVSVIRQLIVVLPVSYVICLVNPNLVWLSLPMADASAAAVSFFLYRHIYKAKILPLEERQSQ